MYYDREGRPITSEQWNARFHGSGYKIVRRTGIPLDGGEVEVSTVWLGIDHGFGQGPPLIFETMIFWPPHHTSDGPGGEYCERAATEAGALAEHDQAVAWVREGGWRKV